MYCIDIRHLSGEIIKIRFKSMYKINVKSLNEKYGIIINTVFNYYFHETIYQYLKMFNLNQTFSILNVQFDLKGIFLRDPNVFIKWSDIETKSYRTYYTILSKDKPDFYKAFDYIEEWNVWILYNVVKQILQSKTLLSN